mmetsp:Transcript_29724/g.78935  ORF Transcript_29724/g.78935 Transcript_29724/m.78935 type:complete len:200 (-) Transcript_29724:922-1521(-)
MTRSSTCSSRNSSKASTAPNCTSCLLHSGCTAMCEITVMLCSSMFSRCMKKRTAPSNTCTTCVVARMSRFRSKHDKLDKAPIAILASLRSSCPSHLDKAVTISLMAPTWPKNSRMPGSAARCPKSPHASFCNAASSGKARMEWIAMSTKPKSTIFCLCVSILESPRTMPNAASWNSALSRFSFATAARETWKSAANNAL